MPKVKTELERSIGLLISEIQKHIDDTDSLSASELSLDIMDSAHELLMAKKPDSLLTLLKGQTISQYLGETWVKARPSVSEKARVVQSILDQLE